ncbi:MAG: imidazole glycerol phosphate synthase subunit HisF [Rhodobacterales bacterium]|nr:imidazole glycerol phosphate synthase subunit HisF [Rhodobacterales bacterium]
MSFFRLIARLDVKAPNLVKTIKLEGLRVVGNPRDRAVDYYRQGVDEILYMDIVASLYGRNSLVDVVRETAREIFVPITVGGGIRSVEDARALFNAGADKVALNTAAIADPEVISRIADRFGNQAVVLSVEAKHQPDGTWEAYYDNGRERSHRNAVDWVREAVDRGAGEVLVTSVDREGTRKGFDLDLMAAMHDAVSVPVVASGGMGSVDDLVAVAKRADAACMADCLHFNRLTLPEIRDGARAAGVNARPL